MSIVASERWAVQGVERDRYRPPYAYAVGLTTHGKPELVVTGMSVNRAAELLNGVAAHVLHAPAPSPGERIPLIGGPLVEFIKVDVPTAHLLVADELYGPRLRALQVAHADDRGRWPWGPYQGLCIVGEILRLASGARRLANRSLWPIPGSPVGPVWRVSLDHGGFTTLFAVNPS
jgi:Domain of unknown function (DUF4262)